MGELARKLTSLEGRFSECRALIEDLSSQVQACLEQAASLQLVSGLGREAQVATKNKQAPPAPASDACGTSAAAVLEMVSSVSEPMACAGTSWCRSLCDA